jgi:hypothetical protein
MATQSGTAPSAQGSRRAGVRGPASGAALVQLAALHRQAVAAGRDDLVRRVVQLRTRLLEDDVLVAVLGEFKQGKSTLCNALLRTDVCPVDPDVGTAVPTVLRYGVPPRATGHVAGQEQTGEGDGDGDLVLDLHRLGETVTERRPADEPPLQSVEVHLDRALLRTGLTLVDTPGLGGLESAHGVAALAMLPLAHAVLFVTDAAQELTAPDVSYLRQILEHCPTVLCVVTKTDLHADWARIVELDERRLADAGLDVPVLPVSSLLRMHAAARSDRALLLRSGFPALLEALATHVLRRADELAAAAAEPELAFLAGQLRQRVAAEREVLDRPPEEAQQVVAQLTTAVGRARELSSTGATWQVALTDGIQDLASDVEHDLRQRLLALVRAGEARLDAGDPEAMWQDFTDWVRVEASTAAVGNLHFLVDRAEELAREVAERFEVEAGDVDVDLPVPSLSLQRVTDMKVDFSRSSARRFLGLLTAARVGYGGAVVSGAVGAFLFHTVVLAPVGAAISLAFARRLIRDDRKREVELRRQQAKQELRRYADEVGFVVGKDSRDAVRRTQRHLRDEFTTRAEIVHRSSAEALLAARQGLELSDGQRVARARDLDEQWRRLEVAAVPARGGGAA